MSDIVTIITTVGFPIALVVLGLWSIGRFINERAWPLLTQILCEWQEFERRRADRDAAMDERLITVIENNTRAQRETSERMAQLERGHQVMLKLLKKEKHADGA